MKTFIKMRFIIILLSICCTPLVAQTTYETALGTVEITNIKPNQYATGGYKGIIQQKTLVVKIAQHIAQQEWKLLKRYFSSSAQYIDLLEEMNQAKSLSEYEHLQRLSQWNFHKLDGQTIRLTKSSPLKTAEISFDIEDENITSFHVKVSKKISFAKTVGGQEVGFVKLANSEEVSPTYHDHYLSFYNLNKTITSTSNIAPAFGQIEFEPLEFEYKSCSFGFCKEGTYEYNLGTVISDKDMVENQNGYTKKTFEEVTDMTSFCTSFNSPYTLFNNYTLTAVIVDKFKKRACFLRDGLEPWFYGDDSHEASFEAPIAVEEVGQYIYILDKAETPVIKVLKINHSTEGDYSITFAGNLPITSDNPRDIGGFEGNGTNFLYLAHGDGVTIYKLNPSSGLMSSTTHTLTTALDIVENEVIPLNNVFRIDADQHAGSTVFLNLDNEIISFANIEASTTASQITLDYRTVLDPIFMPTNLAYMKTEQRWYVTDYTGRMHTLDKFGRHIAVGGSYGKSEYGGELYRPAAITPNCIDDNTNDYRYRYIVANEWGYSTGFKLFAPKVTVPELDVFENLNNEELVIAFRTSGKWQHVEKATGITFSGVDLNGTTLPNSIWQSQIVPGTPLSPGDDMDGKINTIQVSPSSLSNLKRGWNTLTVKITVFKNDNNHEIVDQDIDFYWLPSSLSVAQTGTLLNGNFKLNQHSTINGKNQDYIYKDISISDGIGFYGVGNQVTLMQDCRLMVNTNATLYNNNGQGSALGNFNFQPNSSIVIRNGGYICLNQNSEENHEPHLYFEEHYNKGVYPIDIPEYANSSCLSPCEFMNPNSPSVSFEAEVDLASGPAFDVWLTPSLSYLEETKIEVTEVDNSANTASITISGKVGSINLKDLLSYTFAPCKSYTVALYMQCNDYEKVAQKVIQTTPTIKAGEQEYLCHALSGTYQIENFEPVNATWSSSGFNISSTGNIQLNSLSQGVEQTATLTFTDQYGCTVTDDKTIVMKPELSTPVITAPTQVCEESDAALTVVDNAELYIWTTPYGDEIIETEPTLTINNFGVNDGGTYSLHSSLDGCESNESAVVNINFLPKTVVDAGADQTFCMSNGSYVIPASPSGGLWTGPGIFGQRFYPIGAQPGEHELTYTYTNTNNCTYEDHKTITVGPIHPHPSTLEVCQNDALVNLTTYIPNSSNWSGTGVSNGQFLPSAASVGTHTLSFTYQEGGCSLSYTLNVLVKEAPILFQASVAYEHCEGDNVQFVSTNYTNAQYTWSGPNGFQSSIQNPLIANVSAQHSGTYQAEATLNNGCTATSTTQIDVEDKVDIVFSHASSLCKGETISTLIATPVGGQWSGDNISDNGNLGYEYNAIEEGKQYLAYTYTSPRQCVSKKFNEIEVNDVPSVSITENTGELNCEENLYNTQLVANVNGYGPPTFWWQDNSTDIAKTITQSGTYTVTASNICGQTSVSKVIESTLPPVLSAQSISPTSVEVTLQNLVAYKEYQITFKDEKNTLFQHRFVNGQGNIKIVTLPNYSVEQQTIEAAMVDENDHLMCPSSITFTPMVAPVNDKGIQFNANEDDEVSIPMSAINFNTGFTLEAYINTSTTSNGGSYISTILSNNPENNTNVNKGFIFGLNTSGNPYLAFHDYAGSYVSDLVADGQCHHVAVSVSPTNSGYDIQFYVDGNFRGTRSIYTNQYYPIFNNENFVIGGKTDIITNSYTVRGVPFNGNIREVRIWDRPRTNAEISQTKDIQLVGGESDLLGYWKMSETSGQTVYDQTSFKYHGLLGSTPFTESKDPILNQYGCLPPCEAVTQLTSTVQPHGKILLSWSDHVDHISYQVRYRKDNNAWTYTTVNTNEALLSGLDLNTTYEWGVEVTCVGNSTALSTTETFEIDAALTNTLLDLPFNGNYVDQSLYMNTINEVNNSGSPGITYVTDRFGNANAAAYFSGNHLLDVVTSANFNNLPGYSISFFAKPDQVNSSYQVPISKVSPGRDYIIEYNNGRWRSNHMQTGVSGIKYVVDPTTTPANQWVHIGYVYTGSAILLYVDGQLVASRTTQGPANGSGNNMNIGGFNNSALYFKGAIDDMIITREVLTASEMYDIAQSTTLLDLPFNGNFVDQSVYSNQLNQLNGNISYVTDRFGSPNAAAYFSGNHSLDVVTSTNFNNLPAYTISFFAKPDQLNSSYQIPISKISPGRDFIIEYNNGRWRSNHMETGVSGIKYVNDPNTTPANQWAHIAYVYDGNAILLYVNGQLVASKATLGTPNGTGNNMSIGSFNGNMLYFKGAIDDVIIMKKALTAADISTISNSNVSKFGTFDELEEESSDFIISPNPSTDHFTIDQLNGQASFVTVTNLQGVVVYRHNVEKLNTLTFGETLSPGTYMVTISTNTQENKVYKLIKL